MSFPEDMPNQAPDDDPGMTRQLRKLSTPVLERIAATAIAALHLSITPPSGDVIEQNENGKSLRKKLEEMTTDGTGTKLKDLFIRFVNGQVAFADEPGIREVEGKITMAEVVDISEVCRD